MILVKTQHGTLSKPWLRLTLWAPLDVKASMYTAQKLMMTESELDLEPKPSFGKASHSLTPIPSQITGVKMYTKVFIPQMVAMVDAHFAAVCLQGVNISQQLPYIYIVTSFFIIILLN